jgi:hypothetical protein
MVGLRPWRVVLCGLVVAGLLLGAPFTSDPGSQCQAKGKGGGHGGKGHKGHKARAKRHGPKRHHAGHHAAKKHRNGKRHAHSAHKSHGSSSHISHSSSSHISHSSSSHDWHGHNAWDYYWGHHGYAVADGFDVVQEGPVVVNRVVNPARVVEKYVFHNGSFARYSPPGKSEWVESKTDGGPDLLFAEVSRDADWIRLFDSSRNMSLRLPVAGGMSFWSRDKGQTWKTLRNVEKVNLGAPEYPDSSK